MSTSAGINEISSSFTFTLSKSTSRPLADKPLSIQATTVISGAGYCYTATRFDEFQCLWWLRRTRDINVTGSASAAMLKDHATTEKQRHRRYHEDI